MHLDVVDDTGNSGSPPNSTRLRKLHDPLLTQTDVADMATEAGLPLHQQTIQKIETGKRSISLDEAVVLAEIVGTPLATMLNSPSVCRTASTGQAACSRTRCGSKREAERTKQARRLAEIEDNRVKYQIVARRQALAEASFGFSATATGIVRRGRKEDQR